MAETGVEIVGWGEVPEAAKKVEAEEGKEEMKKEME